MRKKRLLSVTNGWLACHVTGCITSAESKRTWQTHQDKQNIPCSHLGVILGDIAFRAYSDLLNMNSYFWIGRLSISDQPHLSAAVMSAICHWHCYMLQSVWYWCEGHFHHVVCVVSEESDRKQFSKLYCTHTTSPQHFLGKYLEASSFCPRSLSSLIVRYLFQLAKVRNESHFTPRVIQWNLVCRYY